MNDCNSMSDFVCEVRLRISDRLHEHPPSPNKIAGELSLSQRTFQRRLNEAGTNFSALLDEVRSEVAISFFRAVAKIWPSCRRCLGTNSNRH